MGKGDRKTARGKRTIGSYGVSRKRKKSVKFVAKPKKKKAPAKKTADTAEKPVAKKAPAKKKATPAKKKTEAAAKKDTDKKD